MHKELKAVRLGNNSRHDKDKSCLASGRNDNKFGKTNSKVLELLTIGLRKRPEEKSKSRTKRF